VEWLAIPLQREQFDPIQQHYDPGATLVSVSNDGEEIPLDDAERIFAPGVSGTGGAGLGLPLARRLARAAGGDVTADAPAPRFELRLPAG